jgi:di/tricarboxylate transporter
VSLAWVSIAALVVAVTLSCTTTINVGILALTMALLVGVYLGGMSADAVLAGFPVPLLVTLVGVTLLFSIADCNGTLARLTGHAVRLCRGHAGALPIMFFGIGLLIATIGAGGTPASALLAPPAMAVAGRAGVPPLLMAIMAGNGALAGTLSPFAPGGIVANGIMDRIGMGGVQWQTYGYNVLAHATVGFGGFFLLGGWRLFTGRSEKSAAQRRSVRLKADPTRGLTADPTREEAEPEPDAGAMQTTHWLTTAGIVTLIVSVALFGVNVGLAALVISSALILLRTVDEARAIQRMPWGVMLMVTGVTVLVSIMEKTQGLDLFTTGIANVATTETVVPIVAFGSGLISVYSSTSGVVMPAFLPLVPDLAAEVGVLDPLRLAWTITVGGGLVDLSSLSTVGALFLAGAAAGTDTRALFNQLLAWGLSMSVVGAVICWLLFG